MKIALFGATGHIGAGILDEALSRGHDVVAVVRDPSRLKVTHPKLQVVQGDVSDTNSFAKAIAGSDASIASLNGPADALVSAANNLLAALPKAGIRRLVWVGGAGSLLTPAGTRVIDAPDFPEAWKGAANAQVKALEAFLATTADIDWTYVSPAGEIGPGPKTGTYRVGDDHLLLDADGHSRISIADFAAGLVDRAEKNDKPRRRITIAY
ncbi:hypothetical protein EC912_103186 [Luteibacter rhizovicinus]|uniref:NAD(P)-binding domain-containing protein n=1 Tax=Luteibacter rhizovicinus TaxID=242606 RepID=A0A4R3YQL9_9GAMM|nr:NAD(P)H-binding protein [Luteibacter rhizovicinus]TCV94701.1 hypothetical protein EC912_103186 [Luteibacter rhizovicinus]